MAHLLIKMCEQNLPETIQTLPHLRGRVGFGIFAVLVYKFGKPVQA